MPKATPKKRHGRRFYDIRILLTLTVFAVALFGAFHLHQVFAKNTSPIELTITPNLGLKRQVEEFFMANNAAEMIPIIRCESNFRHFAKDGSVLKNHEGSSATGIAQILTSKHPDPKIVSRYNKRYGTDLTVEDLDITTLEGNLGYALMLYQINGTRDWECAKKFRW